MLETLDLKERLDRVIALLAHRVEVLRITKDITEQTQAALGERQREAVLREQLRQLQKELGETDAPDGELAELETHITAAEMPPEVAEYARKELRRLQRMQEASPEYGMVRSGLTGWWRCRGASSTPRISTSSVHGECSMRIITALRRSSVGYSSISPYAS